MSPELTDLLDDAAGRNRVAPPGLDVDAIHAAGLHRRRRARGLAGAATAVVVLAGVSLGSSLVSPGELRIDSPEVTTTSSASASPSESAPEPVEVMGGPSQSLEDAERDGVIPAIAALPFDQRVAQAEDWAGPTRVVTPEGVWLASRAPLIGETYTAGDQSGVQGVDFVSLYEYGEVLLLSPDETSIVRAWPFYGFPPHFLILTEDAVLCGRNGDGALPNSMLCRIDRTTMEDVVRIDPHPEAGDLFFVEDDWLVSEPSAVSLYQPSVIGDFVIVGFQEQRSVFDVETLSPVASDRVTVSYGHIRDLTIEPATLVWDEASWLSYDDAREAYMAETGDTEGPPNDYWIVDDSTETSEHAGTDPAVLLAGLSQSEWSEELEGWGVANHRRFTWEAFAPVFLAAADREHSVLHDLGYWLVEVDGEVVLLEQQYQP